MTRRIIGVAVMVMALALGGVVTESVAEAKPSKSATKGNKKSAKKVAKRQVRKKRCKGKRCRRGRFSGHGVAASQLRKAPLPRPSGHVVIASSALRESVDVWIYNEDGSYNQKALAQLDRLWRCRKTGEERAVDPRLYEILSIIYDHFGKPINLNSGFRFQRNEGSRHFHASAMDVQIEGVSYRTLYEFAQTLDRGGMGIGQYPRSGFVHIDFRAPGEPSYRWTDTSGGGGSDPGKLPSKMWNGNKPSS